MPYPKKKERLVKINEPMELMGFRLEGFLSVYDDLDDLISPSEPVSFVISTYEDAEIVYRAIDWDQQRELDYASLSFESEEEDY